MRWLRRTALALLLAAAALPAQADPLPFARGSWQQLRTAHAGQATVVHLWGLTCGPCLVELPEWGKLARSRPDLKLVLVAADPIPESPERVTATLGKAGLGAAESWIFTDLFNERLRFEIDPRWRGELPRTLLIARDGTVTALSGVADLATVRAWLDVQARAG